MATILPLNGYGHRFQQDAQLSQRDRAAGYIIVFAKSGRRGRPPPIIFARLVRPMNALQLCSWQFSHKETL